MIELKEVIIYTDGACIGNPGPGGYGVVILYNNRREELSGGFRCTTNNRMEIIAAIAGLEALSDNYHVTLYSDSQYLVHAISKGWVNKWKSNNWMRNKHEQALNQDLWKKLLALCETNKVEFIWVRGHKGNNENERSDYLATAAAHRHGLPADEVYEQSKT